MRIFVSVASYRDPLLKSTIDRAYFQAKNKNNIFFGIFDQNYEEFSLDLDYFEFKNNITYERIDPENARGVCFARSKIQSFWKGEEYYLQIDSHTIFEPDWDEILVNHIKELKKYCEKPVISCYPNNFKVENLAENYFVKQEYQENTIPIVRVLQERPFIGWHPPPVGNWIQSDQDYVHGFFVGACFIFSESSILQEVPYDKNIFFAGEESNLSLRLWTNGYDIFHAKNVPLYHCWEKDYSTINIFSDRDCDERRIINIEKLEKFSQERLYSVISGFVDDEFGIGKLRSYNSYVELSGIDFVNQKITKENFDIFNLDYRIPST